ncbi:hypothetical protein [Engelhardtia mirabilis]
MSSPLQWSRISPLPITAGLFGAALLADAARAQVCSFQRLGAPDGAPGDGFGWAIERSDNLLLVTAPGAENFDAVTGATFGRDGAAYLFQRGASGRWVSAIRIEPPADLPFEGLFGRKGGLSGGLAVIGTGLGDTVYPFELLSVDQVESEPPITVAEAPGASAQFDGIEVVGDRLFLRVRGSPAAASGARVVAFQRAGGLWVEGATIPITAQPTAGDLVFDGQTLFVSSDDGQIQAFQDATGTGAWQLAYATQVFAGGDFGLQLELDGPRLVALSAATDPLHPAFPRVRLWPFDVTPVGLVPLATFGITGAGTKTGFAIDGDTTMVGLNLGGGSVARFDQPTAPVQPTLVFESVAPEAFDDFGQAIEFDAAFSQVLVGARQAGFLIGPDAGFVEVVDLGGNLCSALMPHPDQLSVAALPGTLDLALDGPPSLAGATYCPGSEIRRHCPEVRSMLARRADDAYPLRYSEEALATPAAIGAREVTPKF